jgi:hypothetical protein
MVDPAITIGLIVTAVKDILCRRRMKVKIRWRVFCWLLVVERLLGNGIFQKVTRLLKFSVRRASKPFQVE